MTDCSAKLIGIARKVCTLDDEFMFGSLLTFRNSFPALDYEEPEDFKGTVSAFSQIGPPRNVSVEHRPDGEFRATWEPPIYGEDMLSLYIIRFAV